jgi:hypothetical protein
MALLLKLQDQERRLEQEWLSASSTTPPQQEVLVELARQWADNLNSRAELLQGKRNLEKRLIFLKQSRQRLEKLCERSLGDLIASSTFKLPSENGFLTMVAVKEQQPASLCSPQRTTSAVVNKEIDSDSDLAASDGWHHLDIPTEDDDLETDYPFTQWAYISGSNDGYSNYFLVVNTFCILYPQLLTEAMRNCFRQCTCIVFFADSLDREWRKLS